MGSEESNIVLIVLIGTLIVFLLVMAIITFAVMYSRRMQEKDAATQMALKEKELENLTKIIAASDGERERISRRLHDDIGPVLASYKFRLTMHIRNMAKGELVADDFESDKTFIDDVIADVRNLSHDLSPHFVVKFGLARGIENAFEKMADVKFKLNAKSLDENQVPIHIKSHAYSMIMELVNNTCKHGNATKVNVLIENSPSELFLKISHNGEGIDLVEFNKLEQQSKGIGLTSVRSRVKNLNATLEFDKRSENSEIRIQIPLEQ